MFDFLSQKFSGILGWMKDKGRLTEENIQDAVNQVQNALLDADVPYELVQSFLSGIKSEIINKKLQSGLRPGEKFIKIVYDKLLEFLGGGNNLVVDSFQIPSVIMVMGLQGSGKTTTVAKLANYILKQAKKNGKNRKILLASVDFYRPAAIEQLKILAKQVGVDFYAPDTSNSLKAAQDIYNYYKKNSYQLLFLDTAGRLHIDQEMIEELKQIDKNLEPKYKILVLDSMTGQESLNVAKVFDKSVGFNSAILTKMDSDTRGGAAFSFKYELKKNIIFVGSGEKIDDIESFIPERMASRILGMGDILTLIEKSQDLIDEKKSGDIANKLMAGNFTLQDFLDQIAMVSKMGSLQKIAKYLPGANAISPEMLEKSQEEMKKFKAIISSMTKKERFLPQILDASRKKRIALGSGVLVSDINILLQKFEQSKQFAKMFRKFKPF
ncbi:signal recognition particle protein [Candidatus Dependentiae bacterium]|nr:signal recognition particle protein [Candidatus Dependentiae bacterium]MBU4387375.1 signal recognition particle protein [Candidatus Dependentiae bacterium]MCG2756577.1 signal recognition particle protein [Candidatus Dependentiae bacterium]